MSELPAGSVAQCAGFNAHGHIVLTACPPGYDPSDVFAYRQMALPADDHTAFVGICCLVGGMVLAIVLLWMWLRWDERRGSSNPNEAR